MYAVKPIPPAPQDGCCILVAEEKCSFYSGGDLITQPGQVLLWLEDVIVQVYLFLMTLYHSVALTSKKRVQDRVE